MYSFDGTTFTQVGTILPEFFDFEFYGDAEIILNGIIYIPSYDTTTGFRTFFAYNIAAGTSVFIPTGQIFSEVTLTNNGQDMIYMSQNLEFNPVSLKKTKK